MATGGDSAATTGYRTPVWGACARCRSTEVRLLHWGRDYLAGDVLPVGECIPCRLVRTGFGGSDPAAGDGCGAGYYGVRGRRFRGFMERAIRWFRRRRARLLDRHHPGPGRVLDVGCGRGLMLAFLKGAGWECVGTERSAELANAVRQDHALDVRVSARLADCDFMPQSFDVVTMWHSLEHVGDPVDALAAANGLLRPGGLLLLEVPNVASWQARIGGPVWFHLDVPRHRYHFSPETLRAVLGGCGFEVIRTWTVSLEYGFYGMWQTLLNRVTSEPNVLYRGLRHRAPSTARLGDVLLTTVLLPPVVLAGTLVELGAVLVGKGAVIGIVARATSPGTSTRCAVDAERHAGARPRIELA